MNTNMQVGQTVYIELLSNLARGKDGEIVEAAITKIGNKYFTLDKVCYYTAPKVEIASLRHYNNGYSPQFKVYLSQKDLEDSWETNVLFNNIYNFFRFNGADKISLDNLRKIKEIISDIPDDK